MANDSDNLARLNLKADIPQRPEQFLLLIRSGTFEVFQDGAKRTAESGIACGARRCVFSSWLPGDSSC